MLCYTGGEGWSVTTKEEHRLNLFREQGAEEDISV